MVILGQYWNWKLPSPFKNYIKNKNYQNKTTHCSLSLALSLSLSDSELRVSLRYALFFYASLSAKHDMNTCSFSSAIEVIFLHIVEFDYCAFMLKKQC